MRQSKDVCLEQTSTNEGRRRQTTTSYYRDRGEH